MILTDYYKFVSLPGPSKTRLDCQTSTQSYEELEIRRCRKATKTTKPGVLKIYCTDVPDRFSHRARRKADKNLTIGSGNMSSVFIPKPEAAAGYGDFRGTADGLLFLFENFSLLGSPAAGAVVEVFIARGQKNNRQLLYNLWQDGQLDSEIEALRASARPEPTTDETGLF